MVSFQAHVVPQNLTQRDSGTLCDILWGALPVSSQAYLGASCCLARNFTTLTSQLQIISGASWVGENSQNRQHVGQRVFVLHDVYTSPL